LTARHLPQEGITNHRLLNSTNDDVFYGAGGIDAGVTWHGFRMNRTDCQMSTIKQRPFAVTAVHLAG
jgi:hypothetical protein